MWGVKQVREALEIIQLDDMMRLAFYRREENRFQEFIVEIILVTNGRNDKCLTESSSKRSGEMECGI